MADQTEISWTDSTFNPWWGCTKVSPGCDHCYAEAFDKRWGGKHWGHDAPRRILSEQNWNKPLKWNKAAVKSGVPHKVFCASMCDWCDKDAPEGLRDRLWDLIRATPMLQWQMLTKRAMLLEGCLPDDWGSGYDNVWLGVTCEDRKHGFPRVDILRSIPARIRFLSCEPMLETLICINLTGIDWVIVGGESGPRARPMEKLWVYDIFNECGVQRVPFFFKQWGGRRDKGGCVLNGREWKEWPVINE